jgi:hypothetical protein
LTQNKAKVWKKLILTLVFKKNANFFAGNWEKSQKIVIITSTPARHTWQRKMSLDFFLNFELLEILKRALLSTPFFTPSQGDQMSLRKNRPKCSPNHFLSKFMHNL